MESELNQFVIYMTAERNFSPLTIGVYRREIEEFGEFLRSEGLTAWSQADRPVARKYLAWLGSRDIVKGSMARRIAELHSFYRFMMREGLIKDNPLATMRAPKTEKLLPEFLTPVETVALLNVPDTSTPLGLRDRAMLEMLYAGGIRVSELVGLKMGDVTMSQGEALVWGKGAKERIVLVGRPAIAALERYLSEGRPKLAGSQPEKAIFLNRLGKPFSVRGVQRLLEDAATAAGLTKNITPHTLRHTFATHLLNGGADLRVVQELLGHANVSTTQIYTHVTQSHARGVYMRSHPMARKAQPESSQPREMGSE